MSYVKYEINEIPWQFKHLIEEYGRQNSFTLIGFSYDFQFSSVHFLFKSPRGKFRGVCIRNIGSSLREKEIYYHRDFLGDPAVFQEFESDIMAVLCNK